MEQKMEQKILVFSRCAAEKLSSIFHQQKFSKIEKSGKTVAQELRSGDDHKKVLSNYSYVNGIKDIDSIMEKKVESEISEECYPWKGITISLLLLLGIFAFITVILIFLFPTTLIALVKIKEMNLVFAGGQTYGMRTYSYDERFYRGAVYEHTTYDTGTRDDILAANLKAFGVATRTAAENGADIIVFPEYSLHPHYKGNRNITKKFAEEIPNPKEIFVNPCDETEILKHSLILNKLSCMAQQNNIYIVANMVSFKESSDKETCYPGNGPTPNELKQMNVPRDGYYLFNANVVFDRKGNLIGRYYKRHLWHETESDPPICPENIIFETEFGKFTTLTCFDGVFEDAILLIEEGETLNLAVPVHSADTAPFILSASVFAQAWGIQNRVNLLVANGHLPSDGITGSGIYSSSGALLYARYPEEGNRLLISNIPRKISDEIYSQEELDVKQFEIFNDYGTEIKAEKETDFKHKMCVKNPSEKFDGYNCFQIDTSTFSFTKLVNKTGTIRGCQNDLCCDLTYESYTMEEDYYLGVFSGKMFLSDVNTALKKCMIFRCESENVVCARFSTYSSTIFKQVELKGNFTSKTVYPYALKSNTRLLDISQWRFDRKSRIAYNNSEGNSSLLVFGMMSRDFDKDEYLIPRY